MIFIYKFKNSGGSVAATCGNDPGNVSYLTSVALTILKLSAFIAPTVCLIDAHTHNPMKRLSASIHFIHSAEINIT